MFDKFKNKKKLKALEASPVRSLEEIQKDYGQLCAHAGQTQYQIHVLGRELESTNDRIEVVNREAHERKQLEAKIAAAKAEGEKSNG